MKKFLALLLVSIMAMSMSGCGNDPVVQDTGLTDESGNVISGTTIEGAGEEVNLDALEGETLQVEKTDSKDKATYDSYVVSIEDAKILDYNDQKNIVITFSFKNKGSEALSFDNVMVADVFQGNSELMGNVVQGVEGVNILSAVEMIEKGDTTTVQKVYRLVDEETPVKVAVYEYGKMEDIISKTFKLK